jgi:hypothetical protein
LAKFPEGIRVKFVGGDSKDYLRLEVEGHPDAVYLDCVGTVTKHEAGETPHVVFDDGNTISGWLSNRYEVVAQVSAKEPAFDLLAAMTGKPLKFRSGCAVKFVSYSPDAKPHCQLVLLNPSTGNIVTRYANGKSSEEPYNEPGDILNVETV